MAEEEQQQTTEEEQSKKKGSMRTIILIAAVLMIEAVGIVGVMMFLGRDPEVATADPLEAAEISEDDKIVEVLVLDAKLPNSKAGVTFIYKTELYVQVIRKDEERVQEELDQFRNEIRAELVAIWRASEPHHFEEPKHETLTRKVSALLNERFGRNSDSGDPIVRKIVIVMGTGFRIDS